MNGFLNIDKPQGLTSFDIVRELKKVLPRKIKLGHLGTLDPMAQGVLPVAVGHATRVIQYIGDDNKEYIAEMTFGGISDTQDAWGNLILTGKNNLDIEKLNQVLKSYRGVIEQVPPMYSAVHHNGQRLYELARKGITVERAARQVEVKSLDVLQINLSDRLPCVRMKIACSKGTYIRTLCHDIGEKLGTGAFLSSLLRTKVGVFNIGDAYNIEHVKNNTDNIDKLLLPVDYPLVHMPGIKLNSEVKYILNGNSVEWDETYETGQNIRVYTPDEKLIAIAAASNDNGRTEIKPVKVFKST